MCPVVNAIVATCAFQRLRHISQLGCAESVYINVNHSRFEHSLGVSHLAEKLARRIMNTQPALGITEKDILCVKLGALLHDIGHGPFSHVFELFVTNVLPKYRKEHPEFDELYENIPDLPKDWKHEHVSLMMIDCVLAQLGLAIDYVNQLDRPLVQIGDGVDARTMRVFDPKNEYKNENDDDDDDEQDDDLSLILTSRDWIFIKECILGGPIPEVEAQLGKKGFVGRPDETKEWLYDIVSNRHSGLDVDKIDYFARDQRRAFRDSGEIETLMIDEAVVTWAKCTKEPGKCLRCCQNQHSTKAGKHLMICYPEKMVIPCVSFFKLRHELHSKVYTHKTVVSAGYVLCDVLCRADPFIRIPTSTLVGKNGKTKAEYDSLPISRAMLDPDTFLQLSESILDIISFTYRYDKRLGPANELLWNNLKTRNLYKCAVIQPINMNKKSEKQIWRMGGDAIGNEILSFSKKYKCEHDNYKGEKLSLQKEDFIVDLCSIHHGQKDKNPLTKMRFVSKEKLPQLSTNPIQRLPDAEEIEESTYETHLPRSFRSCTIRLFSRHPEKTALINHIFSAWFSAVKDEDEMTPMHTEETFDPVMLSQESDNEDFAYDSAEAAFDPMRSPQAQQPSRNLTPKITPPRHRKLPDA